jgi:uncharacterized protein
MLGLSLGKLLLLAVIVAIVWFGFKYVHRVEEVRRMLREAQRRQQQRQQAMHPQSQTLEAEDLVKCRQCGAYVAARSTTSCGRPDCPWGR